MVHNPREIFDRELAKLHANILRLGEMVNRAIENAVISLKTRDPALARQVISEDELINKLRFDIEEECVVLIATQQPAARDLRMIVAAINIVVDIERMGDHAAGIAKTVIRMGDEPLLKPLIDIPKMAAITRRMLSEVLKAYIERDAEQARVIAREDDQVDGLYRAIFDELVEIMSRQPDSIQRATYLLWCAHNLERIGDRVTNIAERVVFVSTGSMRELNI